jgi:hypothetical protein
LRADSGILLRLELGVGKESGFGDANIPDFDGATALRLGIAVAVIDQLLIRACIDSHAPFAPNDNHGFDVGGGLEYRLRVQRSCLRWCLGREQCHAYAGD